MMVAVKFQGTPQVAQSTSTTLQNAACDVSGMCSNIQALSVKQVYPGPVKTADLNLTLISYVPGVLTFTTTYSEDLLAISTHDVLVNTNSSDPIGGKLGTCTTTVNSDNTITWSCYAIIPAGTSVQLTAMALTPVDPSEPLSRSVMVPGAGKCNRLLVNGMCCSLETRMSRLESVACPECSTTWILLLAVDMALPQAYGVHQYVN